MANRPDLDDDDEDFRELYKEYTGPLGTKTGSSQEKEQKNKRSHAGSDEERESKDPNAVPTDFTSREAKVWEAKSKATERNWKKRKEEEMICKLCGESGHFTQGCPTTLGANRRSQDFFERVAARDKHVKALFTDKVIDRIERDVGCKIKMEEKFIIVSGKDRLVLAKGVDAVHKVIKEEGDQRGSSSSHLNRSKEEGDQRGSFGSHLNRSRSPERSPPSTRFRRFESQRPHPGQRNASHNQPRFGRQERSVEDNIREDMKKFSRDSPQAYMSSGGTIRSSHSRSPAKAPYPSNAYSSYDGHNQSMSGYRNGGWDSHPRESDIQPARQYDQTRFPQTLEELELEYKKEVTELVNVRDREEDEENYKHREAMKEMRENYMKKLGMMTSTHAKEWEEFLKFESQKWQQPALQQTSASRYGGYRQQHFPDYDYAGNPHSSGNNPPLETWSRPEHDGSAVNPHCVGINSSQEHGTRYSKPLDNYPARSPGNFGDFQSQRLGFSDFQSQRLESYGKTYSRF